MNQETIDKLRHLLQAATPGPWEAHANAGYCGIMAGGQPLFLADGAIVVDGQAVCFLRNHAPELLDEIERLREDNANLKDDLEFIERWVNHPTTSANEALDIIRYYPPINGITERLTAKQKTCRWHTIDEDEMPGTYKTECGHMFSFCEGDRAENDAVYCQYCGGKIEESKS